MITWGFPIKYSDVAALDTAFEYNSTPMVSAYIYVSGVSGDIVWENNLGEAQWWPNAQAGQTYILGACRILTSATVNGVFRLTTASGFVWGAVNQKYNTP